MVIELFHKLDDGVSAHVRKRITALGLKSQIDFRNVHFDSHREALEAHGTDQVPAIWDGVRLHVGEATCLTFVESIARG